MSDTFQVISSFFGLSKLSTGGGGAFFGLSKLSTGGGGLPYEKVGDARREFLF